MKWILRVLLRLLFRYRTENEGVLSAAGPVLLIPNHVSWIDWLFLVACLKEDWRFVTSSVTAQTTWVHRWIMINRHTFPIDTASPYAVKRMAEFLQGGGRLVLYAEGRLSQTGSLMKLYDGTGFLLAKTHARVITCYLRGINRLRWVRHPGWTRWWPEISAHFSEVLTPPRLEHVSTAEARQRLTRWLRDHMVRQQFDVECRRGPPTVLDAVAEMARWRPHQTILEDAMRQPMTYRRLMAGVLLLTRQWEQRLTGVAGDRVGVLLPNVMATPTVLLSLWFLGKVPAILNFSSGPAVMLSCAQLAGLKRIITSRTFLARAKLSAEPFLQAGLELIYLEDIRKSISPVEKLLALARQTCRPCRPRCPAASSSGVILFTSGSEGVPKGVELTHGNLIANIRQMMAVADFQDSDRFFNALPLFHSFGLTVGTLLPLVRGLYVFLYPSPLHYRMVPTAVYDLNCTVFLGTNTFLNGYARKAHPYDFRALRYLFAGAEKVQENTIDVWARRFGVRILEGYGATECSPVISVNTPLEPKPGCAGRLVPAMEYRVEPVEGVAEGGRLLVRGPNIMRGYLNPEANAQFQSLGGWYDTGDVVKVDDAGYVHILGRLKRFAKVSGEMVSLTAVEEALAGAFPHYGLRCQVAVLSQPDEGKGEALVAVTNEPRLRLEELRLAIKAKGLSNLCVPREVIIVREIPKLGTGKIHHRALEAMLCPTPKVSAS